MDFRAARTAVLVASLALCPVAFAAEDNGPIAKGIQDNSFLIEEAYNQEDGVVQHINTLRRQGRDWFYAYTMELPLGSELHQLSLSLPYAWIKADPGRAQGFGDVQLSYRYQLSKETASRPAIAPRLSWILPTGDETRGLGVGSHGAQFNLPVSKIVAERVTLHGNAGATRYFDVEGKQPTSYAVGGSIVYALSRTFNLMLEGLHEWNESVGDLGLIERERAFTISPGARYAINLPGETQVVLGAAAPIRFTDDGKRDVGLFLYFSVEHEAPALKRGGKQQ